MIEAYCLGSEMNCLFSHEMLRFCSSFPFAHTHTCVHSRRGFIIQQIAYTHVSKYLLKSSLITKWGVVLVVQGVEVAFQSARASLTPKINSISLEWLSQGAERTCQAGVCEPAR